jgi:dolichol kinase
MFSQMGLLESTLILGMGLKKRTEMHWARKLWHMIGVCLIAAGYQFLPPFWAKIGILVLWLGAVPADVLRLKVPAFNEIMTHLFGAIMRDSEAKSLAGTTYLISGVLLISLIFPKDIVILTLMYLAFADPLASVIGIKYGKDKIFGHKSLQGSMAAFTVCALATFAVLSYKGIMLNRILVVSILGGLIGAIAEAVPLGKMDDNFSIPVVSAIGLWILFTIFGGFAPILSL